MRERIKKIMALLLSMTMLTSMVACGAPEKKESESTTESTDQKEEIESSVSEPESEYPEYLNLDSAYPIIKEGYEDAYELDVMIVQTSAGGDWEDLWVSKYLKEKYNLELNVEVILDSALSERKNLMLNSGDLPDMIIGMGLSTSEILNYGVNEGLFLKCDEYINETLTPGIYRALNEDSYAKSVSTAPDGHIYSLPKINRKDDEAIYSHVSYNLEWLEEVDMDYPATLDEFTALMYAVKEADPAGVGSENVYPMSGGMGTESIADSVLSAFGYTSLDGTGWGYSPAIKDGEVVIPAYDMEVYKEYLALLKQYYDDGIISPDFFTIEYAEVIAHVMGGQTATYSGFMHAIGVQDFTTWGIAGPMTSQWCDEPKVAQYNYVTVGGFAISADTEYPELCMRFADIWFNYYDDDPYALWAGHYVDSEWNYGIIPETVTEDGTLAFDVSNLPDGIDNQYTYMLAKVAGSNPAFGNTDTPEAMAVHHSGYNPTNFDLTTAGGYYRDLCVKNVVPYATQAFPGVYYLDEETNDELSALKTVIHPYIKEQVAKFVVGERSLDETDMFVEELEDMGIKDLLAIYQQIYEQAK